MSYDLHLSRTRDWVMSIHRPITRAEWTRAANANPHLSPQGSDGDYGLIGREVSLYHDDEGAVTVTGVVRAEDFSILADLAKALGAYVVGDDFEEYDHQGESTDFDENHPEWGLFEDEEV